MEGGSLFPRAHVCVDGHAVVGSIAQLLLANFCTVGKRGTEDSVYHFKIHVLISKLKREKAFTKVPAQFFLIIFHDYSVT